MKGGNAPGLNQSTMNFNRKTDGERLRGSCVCSIVVLRLGDTQENGEENAMFWFTRKKGGPMRVH